MVSSQGDKPRSPPPEAGRGRCRGVPRSRFAALAACLFATVALLVGAATVLHANPPSQAVEPRSISIGARPIPFDIERPEETRFGKLTWLGGVQLIADHPAFGGWSGLTVDADGGRLLAVSDTGYWLTATIDYEGGRIATLSQARLGSLRDTDGSALLAERDRDAEAVTPVAPGGFVGDVYIAFERRHRIGVFPFDGTEVGPARRHLSLPRDVQKAPANAGIEGIAVLRGPHKGTLAIFTERFLDAKGNHRGWLMTGSKAAQIALRRRDDYSVTDLAALPDGGLMILERRFRWSDGVRMRIRRVAARDIRPGALLDGEVLIVGGLEHNIDNMEGMALHRDAQGRVVITLISDDNYNFLQRTLLMQFRLDD